MRDRYESHPAEIKRRHDNLVAIQVGTWERNLPCPPADTRNLQQVFADLSVECGYGYERTDRERTKARARASYSRTKELRAETKRKNKAIKDFMDMTF